MNMFKKILTAVGLLAALSVGVTAHAAVTEIQPDKNIGVYTKNQAVSFVIVRDDTTEAEGFSFIPEQYFIDFALLK